MDVHIGLWTNWSIFCSYRYQFSLYINITVGRGRVLGATITVPGKDGALFIAALSLVIIWCGNQLWTLVCYSVYQLLLSGNPRNAFHRQFLVLLRNNSNHWDFLWRLLQLSWTWRANTRVSIQRALLLISLAFVHGTFFAAAGIFSSRVASATSEALMVSNLCGFLDLSNLDYTNVSTAKLQRASALHVIGSTSFDDARTMSRNCYDPYTVTRTFGCPAFVNNQKLTIDAPCPFSSGSCQSSTISVDSGYLDSNDDLGINAPPSDRIRIRKLLTCAVIPLEDKYSSEWIGAESLPEMYSFPTDPSIGTSGVHYKFFNAGPSISGHIQRNFTFFLANFSSPTRAYNTL